MKSYEERLPLIDAAIENFNGEFPQEYNNPCLLQWRRSGKYCTGTNDYNSGETLFICTRDEFNQRKAERQNKPNWADAPEWANWLAQDEDGVWFFHEVKPNQDIDGFYSNTMQDTPKEKGEVIGNWQDTLEKRPDYVEINFPERVSGLGIWDDFSESSDNDTPEVMFDVKLPSGVYKPKEQDMSNNWYEKGELPPAGEKVIAIDKRTNADGNKCELRYISSEVCVLYDIYDDCEFAVHPCHVEFLPLRTETDKLVEQMCNDAIVGRDKDVELNPVIVAAIERLAEHGYRKIKPMSEDEFKQKAKLLGCTSDYLLGKLYRAGCRFIEQVKS